MALERITAEVRARLPLAWFTASNLTLQGSSLIAQFVCLRYVTPDAVGVYQSAGLVNTYLAFAQLGVVGAMNREYPYLLAKGDREGANRSLATAQGYNIALSFAIFALFLGLALYHGFPNGEWSRAFFAVGSMAIPRLYGSYLEGTFRAGNEFARLAYARFGQVAAVFVSIALPWKLGFTGFLLREFLLAALFALAIHITRPVRIAPRIERKILSGLLSTGWKLLIWNYAFHSAQAFPRLVLATLAGALALGLYTPVSWMQLAFSGVTASITAYAYPKLTIRYAKTSVPIGRQAFRMSLYAMGGLAPIAVAAAVIVPFALLHLLPQYVGSTRAAQIALLTAVLDAASISTVAFAAMKAWASMAIYLVGVVLLKAIAPVVCIKMLDDPVTAVAIGNLIASAGIVALTWLTLIHADKSKGVTRPAH